MGATPQFGLSPCPGGADIFEAFSFIVFYSIGPRRSRRKGRSGRPLTPPAPSFLMEEKMEKDHLGGHPLKTPRGSALAASPISPPRPDSSVVGTSTTRARRLILRRKKFYSLYSFLGYRATVRQPVSPVSSANGSASSECNLIPFRANQAGRSHAMA